MQEVARLAYTANVALGSLTVKHTELTRSKEVLQEELSSVKVSVNGSLGCTKTDSTIK